MKNLKMPRIVRRSMLAVLLGGLMSCATAPKAPVVWYALSPPPSTNFPQGNLATSPTTWDQVAQFNSMDECQKSMGKLRAQLGRPVECIGSDDPRLTLPQRKPGV